MEINGNPITPQNMTIGIAVFLQLICKHIIYLIISDIATVIIIFAQHLHNRSGCYFGKFIFIHTQSHPQSP